MLKILLLLFLCITSINANISKIGVSLIIQPQGEKIFFESNEPCGAALFQRKNSWIVAFDVRDQFDLASFSSTRILSNIEPIKSEFAVLKFDINPKYFPKISKYEKGWIIELQEQKGVPCKEIHMESKENEYIFKDHAVSRKITFTDPLSNNEVFVFPTKTPNECINDSYNYMNFSLFKTLQGIAVNPKIDKLRTNYSLTNDLSILIPSTFASSRADVSLYGNNPESMALEFLEREIDGEPFFLRKQRLMEKITQSTPQTKNKSRLEFAQFLISFALAEEAYDYLENLKQDDPKIEENSKFLILMGLSSLLRDELSNAEKYLSHPLLKESGDAPFYLNLTHSLLGTTKTNLNGLFKLFPYFPYEVKIKIGIKTIYAALNQKSHETAREAIRTLNQENLSNETRDLISYYQGVLYENDKLPLEAAKIFSSLENSHYPKIRVLSKMKSALKDRSSQEKRTQIIQDLEKLRFSLTDSPIEVEVLENIASLYLSNKNWIKALRTWKKILKYYPTYTKKDSLEKNMRTLFMEQYTLPFIKSTPIFHALGLFDEFSFLIQDIENETKITLDLAQLCKEANLNTRATNLLNQYLKKTPSKEKRMAILLKLAQVQSKTGKDREVLKTVQLIDRKMLDPSNQKQLDLLQTSTLYKLGEISLKNQDVLPGDNSYEAHQFRARIYWSFKDWERASDALKNVLLLSSPEAISTQNHVIYYAIAVRYWGNYPLLKELRDFYLPQLKGSQLQELFNLVTTLDTVMDKLNIPDLKDALDEIKTLEKFMEEYKKQLGK